MTTLAKLKALCNQATLGPWDYYPSEVDPKIYDVIAFTDLGVAVEVTKDNAAFIASARTALPLLIELVEAFEWEGECHDFYIKILVREEVHQ